MNEDNFSDLLKEAINPLHQLVLIAEALSEITLKQHGDYVNSILENQQEHFHRDSNGKCIYPSKELAGVAGCYQYLLDNDYEVIFANDLSLEVHGIDAVAKNLNSGNYVICESKGTALKNFKTPSYYLKNTKRKGRQLSWQWCWQSLIDYAEVGTTAHLFLLLLEPILNSDIKRLLTVSLLDPADQEFGFVVRKTKVWNDFELSQYSWLEKQYDLSKQQSWYMDLK